ncbi:MAG: tetratricopeptide repeat protein [Elusimicrobiota bacterium]
MTLQNKHLPAAKRLRKVSNKTITPSDIIRADENTLFSGKSFYGTILFADIVMCSEISNNSSIEDYAYIIHQFHCCAGTVYDLLNLDKKNSTAAGVEIAMQGDEACLKLHTQELDEGFEANVCNDVRNAILYGTAIKILWRFTDYNRQRMKQGLFPRDVAVGINQGPVFLYDNKNFNGRASVPQTSVGYAINLAKRIETESRTGEYTKIYVSNTVKYWTEKQNLGLAYRQRDARSLKGISETTALYEISEIGHQLYSWLEGIVARIRLDRKEWATFERIGEMNPHDFWTKLIVDVKKNKERNEAWVNPVSKFDKPAKKVEVTTLFSNAYQEYIAGNYLTATKILGLVIKNNPKLAEAYFNRGNAYMRMKEYERAIEDYTQVLELEDKNVSAYTNRGNARFLMNKYDEAIQDYDHALVLSPGNAAAYTNRGNAYCKLQQYSIAVENYRKAIELEPKDEVAYENLVETLLMTMRFDDAMAVCIPAKDDTNSSMRAKLLAVYVEFLYKIVKHLPYESQVECITEKVGLSDTVSLVGLDFNAIESIVLLKNAGAEPMRVLKLVHLLVSRKIAVEKFISLT